jgi:hypothetical protein
MLGGKFAARLPRALLAFGTMGSTRLVRGIPLPFEPFGQILVPAWVGLGITYREYLSAGLSRLRTYASANNYRIRIRFPRMIAIGLLLFMSCQ